MCIRDRRWSFAATGLVSFLYFLLFFRVYRDPVDDPGLTDRERDYILDRDTAAAVPLPPAETASLGYLIPVSYTHLDVYKRQELPFPARRRSARRHPPLPPCWSERYW